MIFKLKKFYKQEKFYSIWDPRLFCIFIVSQFDYVNLCFILIFVKCLASRLPLFVEHAPTLISLSMVDLFNGNLPVVGGYLLSGHGT